MSGSRLPTGGDIDRDRPLGFTFDGRDYQGFAGDTLASALLANGVDIVGRSFKYHRPRGLLGAGVEEPNALMAVGRGARATVSPPATRVPLVAGLEARAVNCWPNAASDIGAGLGLLSRFIPAGFYYKSLMWPDWRLFEAFVRRAAGLGRPADQPDPDRYETRFAHCDVLVVGAGPAGLAAALAAGRSGARIILCEQEDRIGGRLLWDEAQVGGRLGRAWAEDAAAAIRGMREARLLTRTTAVGYFDHNALALLQAMPGGSATHRLWQVRAGRVILAGGAFERPLVFPGNDRPGVMLAEGVRRYIGRWAVLPGRRAVIFTNNNAAYATARTLLNAGGEVVAVVDVRRQAPESTTGPLRARGVEVLLGAEVVNTRGRPALHAVDVRTAEGAERRLAADLLAVSGGFSPALGLYAQSGGKPRWDDAQAMFVPGPSVQPEASVGAAAGRWGLARGLADGHAAGIVAARATGFEPAEGAAPFACGPDERLDTEALWRVAAPGKAFVDFQNDVTVADIDLAAQENYRSIEHLKRYTAQGMATDQGKTSNVNALAIMGELTGRSPAETGVIRDRFPFTPIPFGALAGRMRGEIFRPRRHLPVHDWHAGQGAVFEEYGAWARPSCYPRRQETALDAEHRESRAVREAVGLFDGSPLGKFEVRGPDAGVFLDRIYANTMSTLKVGRARYGLMLNEMGVVIDDGVTTRLADDRFMVGATGAGAARIGAWLEEWIQCEWPDLRVLVCDRTTSLAVATLSGPRARDVLRAAGVDFDLDPAVFPHMAVREGVVAGVRARVYRVSFTGELSYEINVAAGHATTLWRALAAAGEPFGLTPVGIDAWMLLRTEKGYLHMGAETDGTTSPDDIGWGHVLKRKSDFIGRRALTRPENLRADRLQFVGLEPVRGAAIPVGAHLRRHGEPGVSEGYVTSAGFSPTLGRWVALGMLRAGRARHGEVLGLSTSDGAWRGAVTVTAPGAYDPEGARLND